jgi:hypothetical protein
MPRGVRTNFHNARYSISMHILWHLFINIYIHRVFSLIFLLKLTLHLSRTMNAYLLQTSSIRLFNKERFQGQRL